MTVALLIIELMVSLLEGAGFLSGNWAVFVAISYQLGLCILGVNICIRKKELLCSPFLLFFFMSIVFSVFGEVIYIVRDYLGIGWGGLPDEVAAFYRRFCFAAYFLFLLSSGSPRQSIIFSLKQIGSNGFFSLAALLILGYVGIFISTSGFSQISIFSDNPDALRYANREIANVAVGSLLLVASTIATIIMTVLRASGKITRLSFYLLFIVFYIPLLLSASRLLMLLPFLYIALVKVQYLEQLRGRRIGMIAIFGALALGFAFVFGAYRSHGGLQGFDSVLRFLATDSFPEFSGTVFTQAFVSGESFITPLSTVLSGLFPNRIFQILGINKFDYFQLTGKLLGDMWNSQYSIRLSLIGELYYTERWHIGLFIGLLVLFMSYLHRRIYTAPTRFRYVYVATGLLVSLSIPYGAQFLIIAIQFLAFILIVLNLIRLLGRLLKVSSRFYGG